MPTRLIGLLLTACLIVLTSCQSPSSVPPTGASGPGAAASASAVIPPELSSVPDGYTSASAEPGTLEKLTYSTFESFSYEAKSTPLTKTAWVYLPHGYSGESQYNVLYLSHGGWSNETTLMGTPDSPHRFKHIVDNAIEDGRITPLIIVLPTYNNTSASDSGDYGLALQLTDNFHRELVNDLVPAVESRWSTYAEDATPAALAASRDHRAFGGFSMGSVNTWHTFEHSLNYFRYFMPMSGALTSDGGRLASFVSNAGRSPGDFFIFAMSGSEDFAYSGFTSQIQAMESQRQTFITADRESQGNLAYRVRAGYRHDGYAADEYTYNGLLFFWSDNSSTPTASGTASSATSPASPTAGAAGQDAYGLTSRAADVMADPVFAGAGRLIFPAQASIGADLTLANAGSLLPWYTQINPDRTVAVVNDLHRRAAAGESVFFDLYSAQEKAQDPAKNDTGLFFFRGQPRHKVALVSAGGGFSYVGALHDSFPHAQELARRGYNAFALIYRPGAQTGAEDLARAIAFVHDNADRLNIDVARYSLWGGSAGARLSAWLGAKGTAAYGAADYPRPAAVITQYTGLSEVTGKEPPTYACVGTDDGIASASVMQQRIEAIRANGTDAQIEIFDGLGHGFGLGEGTVAQGWLDRAVAFWQRQ